MVLQMHFAVQGYVASGMGTHDRLTVRMMAEMLSMKVFFEVAATGESPQAIGCR